MRSARRHLRARAGLGAACAVLALALIGSSSAGAAVYPSGGGQFNGGAEGWTATEAKCDIIGTTELGVVCKGEGGYDGDHGSPAGSLAAKTTATVNLLSLFKSKVVLQSPEFSVSQGGAGTLSLDRQFEAATLATVGPKANYSVTLVDKTSGVETAVVQEELGPETGPFGSKSGTVNVTAGHTYVLRIGAEISSTVKVVLSGGTGAVRFDNVSLNVGGSGGAGNGGSGGQGGGGNGNGSSALTDSRLESLIKSSLIGPATLSGNGKKVFVKAKCPAKVGRACKVTVQGMLKKGKPATAPRTVKIAKGKSKQLVLKVKPKLKSKVAKRKKLLFKETVKAGPAKATVYKSLKLIRR
jgi:hypothetical protein